MKGQEDYKALVEERIDELLPAAQDTDYAAGEIPGLLANSMRYSLLAGGKRLRPVMFLRCIEMLGGDPLQALDMACAIEMIHTYSLIHDDLPGMDNDTLRRGKPTNHVVYGEGQAILAGDGLLNFAFETMLRTAMRQPAGMQNRYVGATAMIAGGCGVTGMIAGQVLDLYSERSRSGDAQTLEYIHLNKTARMFSEPLRAACCICGASQHEAECMAGYGEAFGLLFQAVDDWLDVSGDVSAVGKTLGKDDRDGKLTSISVYGAEGTRDRIEALKDRALNCLAAFGPGASYFSQLVKDMTERDS